MYILDCSIDTVETDMSLQLMKIHLAEMVLLYARFLTGVSESDLGSKKC